MLHLVSTIRHVKHNASFSRKAERLIYIRLRLLFPDYGRHRIPPVAPVVGQMILYSLWLWGSFRALSLNHAAAVLHASQIRL